MSDKIYTAEEWEAEKTRIMLGGLVKEPEPVICIPVAKLLNRRDILAGMALQGVMQMQFNGPMSFEQLAKSSVAISDALIAELDKPMVQS